MNCDCLMRFAYIRHEADRTRHTRSARDTTDAGQARVTNNTFVTGMPLDPAYRSYGLSTSVVYRSTWDRSCNVLKEIYIRYINIHVIY